MDRNLDPAKFNLFSVYNDHFLFKINEHNKDLCNIPRHSPMTD